MDSTFGVGIGRSHRHQLTNAPAFAGFGGQKNPYRGCCVLNVGHQSSLGEAGLGTGRANLKDAFFVALDLERERERESRRGKVEQGEEEMEEGGKDSLPPLGQCCSPVAVLSST